jgi:hypothetical protein
MIYTGAQVPSCQPQRLQFLQSNQMIGLSRHHCQPFSKSSLSEQIRIKPVRFYAASSSLDGLDDNNFSESSPPPPLPSAPPTQEPKEDVAKLIYHAGRFILYVNSSLSHIEANLPIAPSFPTPYPPPLVLPPLFDCRNPIPYIIQLARFCASSIALTKQFCKPRLSSIISRSIRVLLVVFVFCVIICFVDAGCARLNNYYPTA